jgi:uncharacterized protein YcfJ
MSPLAILACVALAAAVGTVVGYMVGHGRGRDAQWVDDFLAQGRKRQPRERDGKFARKTKN